MRYPRCHIPTKLFNIAFAGPWLNAMLTALSTSSVSIQTLDNDHWNLPTGMWEVQRDSTEVCIFSETAPLKCCIDDHAEESNYYQIGDGKIFRGDRIDVLSQNRTCSLSSSNYTFATKINLNVFALLQPTWI